MSSAANEIPADLARAIEFHGHLCPGLVIGYLAAKVGLERLAADRAIDEEFIAIVENNSCAVDAVQVLTGCTFGKGNLLFKDFGKMVFTFAVRPSGRAVRVAIERASARRAQPPPDVSPQQQRDWKIRHMLKQPPEELFSIREETISLPETAQIHESAECERCGEIVMETRTKQINGLLLCIPCAEQRTTDQ